MDQIGTLQLVLKKAERSYNLLLPLGAPVDEAIDVALEFVEEIRNIQKQQAAKAAEAAAAAAAAAAPSEAAAEEEPAG